MPTTTETFYVIANKKDHTKLFKDFTEIEWDIRQKMPTIPNSFETTNDLKSAWMSRRAETLFFMLEEYNVRFQGQYEVLRIDQTITVDHKSSNTNELHEQWLHGARI